MRRLDSTLILALDNLYETTNSTDELVGKVYRKRAEVPMKSAAFWENDGMNTATTKRPYSYAAFIDELRQLAQEPARWSMANQSAASTTFKAWKTDLTAQIGHVWRLGHRPELGVSARNFRSDGFADHSEHHRLFMLHMESTLVEMAQLVRDFDKYGEPALDHPKAQPAVAAVTTVAIPAASGAAPPSPTSEKVTLAWMWHNVPWEGWATLLGLIGAAFIAGTAVGAWQPVQNAIDRIAATPPAPTAAAPNPPSVPPSAIAGAPKKGP